MVTRGKGEIIPWQSLISQNASAVDRDRHLLTFIDLAPDIYSKPETSALQRYFKIVANGKVMFIGIYLSGHGLAESICSILGP
jgi:hypothetical protein